MSEEQKSNFDQENLNESSNQSSETSGKFRMPWNNKFGEDENLKNRQYSRTARNQPEREATTLSKVLLFMVICVCIVPFILFFWVNASRPQNPSPRTASQVSISRAESSSASSSSASESSSAVASASSLESKASESGQGLNNHQGEQPNQNQQGQQQGQNQQGQQQGQNQQGQQQQNQGGTTYVVQAGDSWYRIAANNGVSLDALLAANGASLETTILPGQTIVIP
ncbi:LysM domain-containing protein [Abiotrophia defectiva]|uniref:LysM peptidoglycan-binding domain-containing protein n=1 Tax=Abiotrophia defectiva TaxID=46125 RepID=UPI0028D7B6D5|nr:LysM domain-containing protein [Abiotrophia defectiva]